MPRFFETFLTPRAIGREAVLRLLRRGLWILMAGTVVYAVLLYLAWPQYRMRLWVPGLVFGLLTGLQVLVRQGRLRAVGWGLSLGLWLVFSVAAWTSGGVHTPGYAGYFLAVVLAGLFLHWRAAVLVAALSVLAGLALALAETHGRLPPPTFVHDALSVWSITAVLLLATAFTLYLASRMLDLTHARAERHRADLARSRSETEALLDAIPDMMFRLDREGTYLAYRPAPGIPTLQPPEVFLGKRQEDVLPPDLVARSRKAIARALDTGTPQVLDYELTLKGERRAFESRLVPLPDDEVLVLIRDITDRVRAEEALRESERKYRQLVELAQEGIWVIDREALTTFVNPAMARILGYAPDEMLGRHLFDFMDDAGREIARRNLARREQGIEEQHDFEFLHKSGARIYTVLETAPLTDEHGVYQGAIAGVVDLTARRRAEDEVRRLNAELEARVAARTEELAAAVARLEAEVENHRRTEEALRLSEARYRAVVEDQSEFICRFRPDGTITFANAAYCRYFGQPREALVGSRFLPELHEEDRHLTAQHLPDLSCRHPVATVEVRLYRGEELRWHQWTHRAICDDAGRIIEYQATGHDITDRKRAEAEIRQLNEALLQRAERLEALNAELEAFSYSVSHDLRAPLRAIHGFADILSRHHRDALSEDGRRYLDHIVEAAGRMDDLINDLLAYARLGRQAVEHRSVSLQDVLAPIADLLAPRLADTGGTLTLPGGDVLVRGDPTLLHQIFLNLLENALAYHRAGIPPEVTVRVEPRDETVLVHVIDNGVGVPAAFQEKIFNVFQRLHSPETHPGTGIGLAQVRKAAAMMGVTVSITASDATGTTFTVRLPRAGEA